MAFETTFTIQLIHLFFLTRHEDDIFMV